MIVRAALPNDAKDFVRYITSLKTRLNRREIALGDELGYDIQRAFDTVLKSVSLQNNPHFYARMIGEIMGVEFGRNVNITDIIAGNIKRIPKRKFESRMGPIDFYLLTTIASHLNSNFYFQGGQVNTAVVQENVPLQYQRTDEPDMGYSADPLEHQQKKLMLMQMREEATDNLLARIQRNRTNTVTDQRMAELEAELSLHQHQRLRAEHQGMALDFMRHQTTMGEVAANADEAALAMDIGFSGAVTAEQMRSWGVQNRLAGLQEKRAAVAASIPYTSTPVAMPQQSRPYHSSNPVAAHYKPAAPAIAAAPVPAGRGSFFPAGASAQTAAHAAASPANPYMGYVQQPALPAPGYANMGGPMNFYQPTPAPAVVKPVPKQYRF